ncbi:MAG TPA: 5-formyltetrahydrofolate cyclo-ligase, partial [Spirochaetia bacterium]|nr:5-formyltetrahydrofolate cyclo-ligase [Spirochaetia bacterium]
KMALRSKVREKLKGQTPGLGALAGEAAARRIAGWEPWATRSTLLSFFSLPSEVDTSRLNATALAAGKLLGLPRIDGESIEFLRVDDPDPAGQRNRLGIREPDSALPRIDLESIQDLAIIVPGIAFTITGKRLGRGGGFYDRFLARVPNALKIALCFDFQIVDEVPTGPTDIGVDWILTESRFFRAGGSE